MIKRYDRACDNHGAHGMEEFPTGEYVEWKDCKEMLDLLDSCALYFHCDNDMLRKSREQAFKDLLKPYLKEKGK